VRLRVLRAIVVIFFNIINFQTEKKLMRYSHRFFLYAPFGLLLLLATTVMVYWKRAADSFDARLTKANGHEIMPGVRFSYASKSMQGFPFRLDSLIDGLSLEIRTNSGLLVWRSQHFATHMLDYDQSRQVFEAAGTQIVSWTNTAGSRHEVSFVPGTLRASAIGSGGGLARFDMDIMSLNSPNISGDRLQFHIRQDPIRNALDFVMEGDQLKLACPSGSAAASRALTVEGRIAPATPFRPLLDGRADWRSAYDRWSKSQGRLDVERIDALAPAPSRASLETCVADFLQHALSFAGRP
jgi:hypothetical protein